MLRMLHAYACVYESMGMYMLDSSEGGFSLSPQFLHQLEAKKYLITSIKMPKL